MKEEIWKDIPGYEGYYQVSSFGRVRSFDRDVHHSNGKTRFQKGRTLKLYTGANGYQNCTLSVNNIKQNYNIHQLVAMTFLNYKPNGRFIVVDHINGTKDDNRLENLQVVTQRQNLSKVQRGTSKHTGVCWESDRKKWVSKININGKQKTLGRFTNENDAAIAYQNALKELA